MHRLQLLETWHGVWATDGDADITASANVKELDPAIKPEEIATELRENVEFDSVLSNSFGFGGTNATLVMSKYND